MAVKMADCGDKLFFAACKLADIPATRRQWKKWLDKSGKAYANKAAAEREVGKTA